ncbi:hypothetical protein BDR22DRAFT_963617 [Usnea florida]
MARFINSKGQPVNISFFDLFFASAPSRNSCLERKKLRKEDPPSPKSPPSSTTTKEAPTEEIKTAESTPAEWTKIEEMGLLGAKALNKTWKEISEALPGKNLEEIKKKYRELYVDAPANIKPKEVEGKKEETKETEENGEKKDEGKEEGKDEKKEEKKEEKEEKSEDVEKDAAKAAEEIKKDSKSGKKYGKAVKHGKKGQKGQKIQKGKETTEEPKAEEAKGEEGKPEEKKGILKAKATNEEKGKGGDLKWIYGHPVIFVDDNEELEYEELYYLYGLSARYDEQKWITVDSKFFDKFGKRVGAEKLKEKLGGKHMFARNVGQSADGAVRIRDPQTYGRQTLARSDTEEASVGSSSSEEETQGTGVNEETVTSPIAVVPDSEEEADSRQEVTTVVESQKA